MLTACVVPLLLACGVSIEVVGLGLGTVGLLVSVIAIPLATVEGGKQLRRLGEVRDGLEKALVELKGEVQTHHIGAFPEFLPAIVEILAKAEKRITIFCDLPAYGVVSIPDRFREYAELIETKAGRADFEVRILHLDEDRRMESLESQFAGSWEKVRKKSGVGAFVDAAEETLVEDDQRANFLALVQREQERTLTSFRTAGVARVSTDLIMPMYFWIADGKEAVFALTEFSPQAHEAGFRTASPKLIEAMDGIYTRYRDRGTVS